MMESRLQTGEIPIGRRIPGATRMGATLSQLSQSLYDEAAHMNEQESAAALEAYFQTLSACFGLRHSAIQRRPELLAQILRFVDAHLSQPTVVPVEVASAMGISLRHLHRVFSATGNTLGEYVRMRRLEQCREDLLSSQLADKSITDIAFSWGFSDAAHFSHAFRTRYGVSPRALRAKANSRRLRLRNLLREDVSQAPYNRFN
jgi:AraC-like DNA-binding protein